ncbi:glycosyltransferase family 39 protein [Nitrosopumilus sp.]|uniref:glycosyltransferase family 39 protein n=1 Tax=Nitrosopumilus sp. TaxID=2024843 RepID=UPI00247C4B37|nr:glycosyltransferase family 39 protein [Nitrosopumilus sp.]MCV0410549.1 glycosyltransferase family 39 protein [Nitrosopumilus sp.]
MAKNSNQIISRFEIIDKKVSLITKSPILFLIGIGVIGFFVRTYYFPWDIPIILDGLDYLSYAVVMSQEGHFPTGWDLSNNGWPSFLSIFFTISNNDGLIEFSHIQRMLTVIISVLTVIPVYLLCARFVAKTSALIGATLFVMDPRIIINSLLGITETSFVFVGAIALFLFSSKDVKVVSASFGILALFTMIRYEGIILLIPFLVLYIIRFRHQKKFFLKLLGVIGIFILILLPMAYFRIQATGNDGIISEISQGGANYLSKHIVQGIPDKDDPIYGPDSIEENKIFQFITLGSTNLIKYLGWVMIPIFIFFVPIGFFIFLQNRDEKTKIMILSGIFLLIPAFYAYGRGIEETRYLYVLFPIFCVFSSFTIMRFENKIQKKGIFILFLICGIFIGSVTYLEYKKIDYVHEVEAFSIAKEIVKIASGVNHFPPESTYIHVAEVAKKWPDIPLPDETGYNQLFEIKKISPENYFLLSEFIKDSKEKGLTHIVVDGNERKSKFLNEIFFNDENYPYLIKEFDSIEKDYKYHVKIYKIDYEKFEEFLKNNP